MGRSARHDEKNGSHEPDDSLYAINIWDEPVRHEISHLLPISELGMSWANLDTTRIRLGTTQMQGLCAPCFAVSTHALCTKCSVAHTLCYCILIMHTINYSVYTRGI